jgi:hypothetical protein
MCSNRLESCIILIGRTSQQCAGAGKQLGDIGLAKRQSFFPFGAVTVFVDQFFGQLSAHGAVGVSHRGPPVRGGWCGWRCNGYAAAGQVFHQRTEAPQAPAPSSSAAWGGGRRGVCGYIRRLWSGSFPCQATRNTPPALGRRPSVRLGWRRSGAGWS